MTLPAYVVGGIAILSGGSTAAAWMLWEIEREVKNTERLRRQIDDLFQREKREEDEQEQGGAALELERQRRPRPQIETPTQLSNKAAAGK